MKASSLTTLSLGAQQSGETAPIAASQPSGATTPAREATEAPQGRTGPQSVDNLSSTHQLPGCQAGIDASVTPTAPAALPTPTPRPSWMPEVFERLASESVGAVARSLSAGMLLGLDPLALMFDLCGRSAPAGTKPPPIPLLVTTSRAVMAAARSAGWAVFDASELEAMSRAAQHDRATWWDVSCWVTRKLERPSWVLTGAEALALHPQQYMARQLSKDCLPATPVPLCRLEALLGLCLVDAYAKHSATVGLADSTSGLEF